MPNLNRLRTLALATTLILLAALPVAAQDAESPVLNRADSEWIQLFNGRDLEGWTPKIRGHELGDNYAETFRVKDGILSVSYDQYQPADFRSMDGQADRFEKFGHLFYEKPFSDYLLKVEYRFVGDQVPNGPGWAFRNNGLMLHGQDPTKMDRDQDFPVSIEVQLLGTTDQPQRSTLNLCTPGTNVVFRDQLYLNHCLNSESETYRDDEWVTVEIEVRGSQIIRHKIKGKTVLEYTQPQLDPRDARAKAMIEQLGGEKLLDGGTISIQSESHPTEFRRIDLLPLQPGG